MRKKGLKERIDDMEIWKNIKGYEGIYQISNLGRIKSLHNKFGNKELIMKQNLKRNGYYQIRLKRNGTVKDFIIHRLVAEAFIPNPNNYPCVNHIDENKTNNNANNLEWCSILYNNTYGNRLKKVSKAQSKKVYQYDFNWKLIKIYDSCKEASKKTGISAGNISQCCNGSYNHAGSYYWRYREVV